MEESELIQEPKGSSPLHGLPSLTVRGAPSSNRTPLTDACPHAGHQQPLVGQYIHQELWCPSADLQFQHFEPRHRAPSGERDGQTRQSRIPEDCAPLAGPAAAHSRRCGAGEQCGRWDCQRRATERATGDTRSSESEYGDRYEDNEELLEQPLPLRSDIDWQEYRPTAQYYTHLPQQNKGNATDLPNAQHGLFRQLLHAVNYSYPPQPHSVSCQDVRPPRNWLHPGAEWASQGSSQGCFSVNVPQFSLPPSECVSQVSVMNLDDLRLGGLPPGEGAYCALNEKRKANECRNIFITYSLDIAAQMLPFAHFLKKQGFRPAIDIFDNPIRRMDINKWMDSYLKDPSVLIIIAISSGYKAAIERTGMDRRSLHTKYIHSMMQQQFMQQGSLNYRFVPVLFHHATQSHVPGWLQNTHVYRWPQDKEILLLRLLHEERYIAPPVPKELTLIIRPVPLSSSATF